MTTTQNTGFRPAFRVSGYTALFLKEFMELTPPSTIKEQEQVYDSLIRKYSLRRLSDGGYALCGFLKKNEKFNTTSLTEKGIEINSSVSDIMTACIPLNQILFFFSQPGIDYFEASIPMNPLSTSKL